MKFTSALFVILMALSSPSLAGQPVPEVHAQSSVSKTLPAAEPETAAPLKQVESSVFESPIIVVVVIGLLQGLISRAGWGQFVIVALVMPALVAWGMLHGQAAGSGYWVLFGMEWLKLAGVSLLAWGGGLIIYQAILRLLHR